MRTDEFFYKLFTTQPDALIKLVQLNVEGQYYFDSINLKEIEKRVDGVFRKTDGKGPNLFLEVQGYEDKQIIWRLFQEVTTYYDQRDDKNPFIAIILFLDERHNKQDPPFTCLPPNQLIRVNLADCLKEAGHTHQALFVLEPLILETEQEMEEKIPQWKKAIKTIQVSDYQKRELIDLLTYAIVGKFATYTREELKKMIITPLEETTAGKELLQIGEAKGLDKGELIGRIHMIQELLKQSITPREELASKNEEELRTILQDLKSQLNLS